MYYENLYYFCTAINKAREQQVKKNDDEPCGFNRVERKSYIKSIN